MNKIHLISAALILPAALFADVSINVNVGSVHNDCEHLEEYSDADYSDDGDPWFEGCESRGFSRVSLEYQWTLFGPRHVLRYRQVTFHTLSSAWVFGPWIIKTNYCHSSCNLHHNHVYFHHNSHPDWGRVYNQRTHVYYYEYRHAITVDRRQESTDMNTDRP